MLKIKFFLFNLLYFIVFFLFFLCKTNASDLSFSDFTTYHLINTPTWPEIGQIQPEIIPEDSIFKMWYVSLMENKSKIVYATSQNGIEWQNHSLITFPPDFDNKNTHNPSILKIDSNYLLFFSSSSLHWDNFKIYKITSSDGINFDQKSLKVVLTTNYNNWEKNAVSDPFIFLKNNVYYLFYSGAGENTWQIGLAYSLDGENWIRCQNNPIIKSLYEPIGSPFLLEKDQKFYLFFHSNLGIEKIESSDNLSCNSNWINREIIIQRGITQYDTNHIISPSLIEKNNQLFLFYSGLNNSGWSLNLVIFKQPNSINYPIILLPGLFASWNKEAILHNQQVGVFDWKLLPFIKEYDGIINTLKNLSYQENQDFFIFPYDWRKSVDQSSEDLKTFIENKIPQDKKVNLIGHSLGGLVARIFTQKYKEKVNKIISVGTPHEGVIQVYKPLSAGEIDQENNFLWLSLKAILVLNKSNLETDKETIRKKFPVAFDLFPTFNFLKNKNNEDINFNNLTIKNNLLHQYNQNFDQIYPIFIAFYGEKDQKTPRGYIVEAPNFFDKLLGNYTDGHPISSYHDFGDNTVLTKSANKDSDAKKLIYDHGEIITEKTSIKEILSSLNINLKDDQIAQGKKTKFHPSLIFFLKSAAKIKLYLPNGEEINDYDGIIFIDEAQTGNYNLQIEGIDQGEYTIISGQIYDNNDFWEYKKGFITKIPANLHVENYPFYFNGKEIHPIFPTLTPTISLIPSITKNPTSTIFISPTPNHNSTNQSYINESSSDKIISSDNTLSSNTLSDNDSSQNIDKNSLEVINKNKDKFSLSNILGEKTKHQTEKKFNIFKFFIKLFLLILIFGLTTLGKLKKFNLKIFKKKI